MGIVSNSNADLSTESTEYSAQLPLQNIGVQWDKINDTTPFGCHFNISTRNNRRRLL